MHPFEKQLAPSDKPKASEAVALMQKTAGQLKNQVTAMEGKIA